MKYNSKGKLCECKRKVSQHFAAKPFSVSGNGKAGHVHNVKSMVIELLNHKTQFYQY